MLRVLAALLALLVLAPAAHAEQRVVGGTQAPAGSYPWQVALLDSGTTSHYQAQFCGGTLISPTRVLTAAHCTQGETPSSIDVLANTTSLTPNSGQRIDVIDVEDHPQAEDPDNGAYRYDVSVLQLDAPVTDPRPLALIAASEAQLWAPGDELTITGWGRQRADDAQDGSDNAPQSGDYPPQLREATVPRRADSNCAAIYDEPDTFASADQFCASPAAGGKDTCQGDSGGPIIAPVAGTVEKTDPADWRLVGATSWGAGCADADYPGVYSRLDAGAIRSFVSAQLSGAPFSRSAPVLSGTPQAGQVLSCSTGTRGNDPTAFAYAFERLAGGAVASVGSGASTYTVTSADVGASLRCVVTATSPNGSGQATSTATGPVTAAPAAATPTAAPSPVATPIATPTPTTPPVPLSPRDVSAPRIASVRRTCTRTRCTLTVRATDTAPSAGLFRISARLTARVRGRTRSRTLSSRRRTSSTFAVTVPRLGRGSYRLTLRAVDRASNRQRTATIRTFRLGR